MLKVRLEGWLFMPHSYSLVFCNHAADLAARPDMQLTLLPWPVADDLHWDGSLALPLPAEERAIRSIPQGQGEDVDAIYRASVPVDLDTENAGSLTVHLTADNGTIANGMMASHRPLAGWVNNSPAHFSTPSTWSKDGLVRAGVPADRVHIVPHGVDGNLFNPGTVKDRAKVHRSLKIPEGAFVFLNVGSMSRRKGIDLLVAAFKIIARQYPEAYLLLKGTDGMFRSKPRAEAHIRRAKGAETKKTFEHQVRYLGATLSDYGIAQLYGAADCYVTPYRAEGFNLPALEAAASGLPVIATAGGPTDEFLDLQAGRVSASMVGDPEVDGGQCLEPDFDDLVARMLAAIKHKEALQIGARSSAVALAQQWSWTKATDRLLEVLKR